MDIFQISLLRGDSPLFARSNIIIIAYLVFHTWWVPGHLSTVAGRKKENQSWITI